MRCFFSYKRADGSEGAGTQTSSQINYKCDAWQKAKTVADKNLMPTIIALIIIIIIITMVIIIIVIIMIISQMQLSAIMHKASTDTCRSVVTPDAKL